MLLILSSRDVEFLSCMKLSFGQQYQYITPLCVVRKVINDEFDCGVCLTVSPTVMGIPKHLGQELKKKWCVAKEVGNKIKICAALQLMSRYHYTTITL